MNSAVQFHGLGQRFFDDFRGLYPRELLVEAAVGISEAVMVKSELVQHRRVEVTDVMRILGDVPTEVVGFANDAAALDARASHPDGETTAMVVPAGGGGTQRTLRENGAPELTAPDDKRIF